MIRKVSFAALAVLGCTAAHSAPDNRIRSMAYDPDKIVQVLGRPGIQSTIEFADDERIENVAVGDSAAWQITPNRRASLLFVKPLVGHSRTNMTVVTDRRTYMFDLVAGEKSAGVYFRNSSTVGIRNITSAARLQSRNPLWSNSSNASLELSYIVRNFASDSRRVSC